MRNFVAAFVVALFAQFAWAARTGADERVEVHVTALAGTSIYVDRGSDAKLAVGDRIQIFPASGATVEGVLRSVTKQSARAEVPESSSIELGARGEVVVPSDRASSADGDAHPPWSQSEKWNTDLPLLAPPQAIDPRERASKLTGRVYSSVDWTTDTGSTSNSFLLARAGTAFDLGNPFGHGGAFHVDAEVDHRTANFANSSDETQTDFRMNRFSYDWGGTRDEPTHFEIGRFFQREIPEFGLIDGFETVHRTDGGNRFGASLGFLPEPTPEMSTGKDLAAAVFYRFVEGANEEFSLGTGLQKTWHEGTADRDLAVADLSWRPTKQWSTWSSAWVDFYESNDTVKSGAELTEFHMNSNYSFLDAKAGIGMHVTHFRFPELLRNEFQGLTPTQLDQMQMTRLGLDAWKDVTHDVRISARVDHWQDQDDDGLGGELRGSWRELVFRRSRDELAVFDDQGKFSSVVGARISHVQSLENGSWNLGYELSQHESSNFGGTQGTLTSSSVRGGYDITFAKDWNLSIFVDDRFGGDQDSVSLGFWLQRRF